MTWIETIPFAAATGRLRRLYDRVKGPRDNVDNIMVAHSLRPHSMDCHMALYKSVLHHSANTIPKWFLEAVGVYTSLLNHCDYCVEHHYAGLRRLLPGDSRAAAMRNALETGDFLRAFSNREATALGYAQALTQSPWNLTEAHVSALREAGWADGEILEINQVVAYFNYANRTVLGLGVDTEGDVLGLSPGDSDDPENWRHA